MQTLIGIAGSTAALLGTFLLYLAAAVLIVYSLRNLFGKRDRSA